MIFPLKWICHYDSSVMSHIDIVIEIYSFKIQFKGGNRGFPVEVYLPLLASMCILGAQTRFVLNQNDFRR